MAAANKRITDPALGQAANFKEGNQWRHDLDDLLGKKTEGKTKHDPYWFRADDRTACLTWNDITANRWILFLVHSYTAESKWRSLRTLYDFSRLRICEGAQNLVSGFWTQKKTRELIILTQSEGWNSSAVNYLKANSNTTPQNPLNLWGIHLLTEQTTKAVERAVASTLMHLHLKFLKCYSPRFIIIYNVSCYSFSMI